MKSALETAMDALSRRALTSWELIQRLKVKGFSGEEISQTFERLNEWGYIDDRRLAKAFCQSRAQKYSRRRLREELRQRGLDLPLIDEVLGETVTEVQELENCKIIIQKLWEEETRKISSAQKIGTQRKKKSIESVREKVGAKLLRRGYSMGIVVQALDIFCKSD